MGNYLKNVVYLSQDQYNILKRDLSITTDNGITHGMDPDNLYITDSPFGSLSVGDTNTPIYFNEGAATAITSLSLTKLEKGSVDTALMGKGTSTSAYVSVSPSISFSDASSTPKINLTVLGVSGTATNIPTASTSAYGITKLSSAIDSDSEVLAATPKAVKSAIASITASSLGLSNALHFIGITTTDMTGGDDSNNLFTGVPTVTGYTTPAQGDVVINSTKQDEWVCTTANGNNSKWERLGSDTSYKIIQTAVTTATAESTEATTFVHSVTQNSNGIITVKTRPLPTYNNYSHPTGDGNLHVPATGTSNNGKVLKAGSTAGSISWGTLDWGDLTGVPSSFTPATHDHDSAYLKLNGSNNMTADVNIIAGDTDKFVNFWYNTNKKAGASWRIGMLGSGSSDTNYFVIQSGTSTTSATTWNNTIRIGQNTYNVYLPGTTASTSISSGALTVQGGIGAAGQITGLRLAANGSNTNYSLYVNGTSYLNGQTNTKNIVHLDDEAIDNGSWTTGTTGTAPTATTIDETTTYSGASIGTSILTIGNNKVGANSASGVANNSRGYLRIYGTGSGYAELIYNDNMWQSTKSIYFSTSVNSGISNEIRGLTATNDYWRVAGGATASNAGYMEIATADDYNEPIYVRQYQGAFTTLKRTLTLLDTSGNTYIPGTLYFGSDTTNYISNTDYTGNAATATSATSINYTLDATTRAYLMGSQNTPTITTTACAAYGDIGVYLTTIAGQLSAKSFSLNDGAASDSSVEKVYMQWNSTDSALEFVFA